MSLPGADDPEGGDGGPPQARSIRWRLAIAAAVAVVAAAAVAVFVGAGRVKAPPTGLAGAQSDAAPRSAVVADAAPTAPPPWAVPAPPPAAPPASPRPDAAAREPAAHRPHRAAAPSAYPPAIEDAIHAALESGRSQPWNALGVKGWVTVSAGGGPDHACRAYRVVRETGATAPETLCRSADGSWRAGL